ncbi:MAG: hypothetical protein Q9191_003663 [Dirinaria sp. TL-2023a]
MKAFDMALSSLLRLPRPHTFLYLMSLRTGTELITLSLLLNKISGFYGLLALLTGFYLSPFQLSMYIYSLIVLCVIAYLAPHIRSQSAFHCVALAWVYMIDSIINAAYTAVFGVTWFLLVSQHLSDNKGGEAPGPGGSTVGDTAGFTNPTYDNISHVDVSPQPNGGITGSGQEAVTVAKSGEMASTGTGPSLGHGVLQSGSISSLVVIYALWAIRIYFVLVVLSYARYVLRQHIVVLSRHNSVLQTGSKSQTNPANPFSPHLNDGKGWKGKLGRVMVSIGKSYWLGGEDGEDHEWMAIGQERLKRRNETEAPGVVERERRRRSGTGPPPPMPQLQAGQYLRVQEPDGR